MWKFYNNVEQTAFSTCKGRRVKIQFVTVKTLIGGRPKQKTQTDDTCRNF